MGKSSFPFLKIKHLSKDFSNKKVLKGINCKVKEGTVVGIIGPNGAGKTTFIKIMATLLKPTKGDFWVDGISPRNDLVGVRKNIGYCPDRIPIDGRATGYEFLKFFGDLYGRTEKQIEQVLELVDLAGDAERPIANYSKGMQKRTSLARVLLLEPKVYLLDEPTSGLDPAGQRMIQNIILSMEKKNRVILLSSHNLYEVERICDEIFIIRNGKFESLDSVSEAFKEDGMTIIDITLKELKDEMVDSILKEFSDLIFLSSGKNRVRFTTKKDIDKDKIMEFIRVRHGDVIEIKYL